MFWLNRFRLKITSTSRGGSKSEDLLKFSGNSFKRFTCLFGTGKLHLFHRSAVYSSKFCRTGTDAACIRT
jgi:hypothetical protein